MRHLIHLVILLHYVCMYPHQGNAQNRLKILTSGENTSIRGLSTPSTDVIWVSGTNGTIGRSVNAGAAWQWMRVPGFDKSDFRDIEAFDSSSAIIMATDNPAYILKTTDGGRKWSTVFSKQQTGIFLDALDFKDRKNGICIGDPLPGDKKHFYILRTYNGGETWSEPVNEYFPAAEGAAVFAASGTNIAFIKNSRYEYAFVSGGAISQLYLSHKNRRSHITVAIPLAQANESSGTFSFVTDQSGGVYCAGGNYKKPSDTTGTFAYAPTTGGKWIPTAVPPSGYKSCIKVFGKKLVACGTNGVDLSVDGGRNWNNISTEGFNVCAVSESRIFLAGEKGKIAVLQ